MRRLAIGMAAASWLWSVPAMAQVEDRAQAAFDAYAAGNHAQALSDAQAAVQHAPNKASLWALIGEAQAVLDRSGLAADAFGRAAATEPDPAKRSYLLRAQVLQLVAADRRAEARAIVQSALMDEELDAARSLDWAMVAITAGEDRLAQTILSNDTVTAGLTRQSALDAAYSAKREGMDPRAVQFFRAGLALDAQDAAPLSSIEREPITREIRELTRTWSVLGQVTYSTAGQTTAFLAIPERGDTAVQMGAEVARRVGGWRNGRPLSLFGRIYHSRLSGEDALARDASQGWLGARYKPLADLNLQVEASRLVGLDAEGIDDWSLRTAISGGTGLEPEIGRRSAMFASYYGDVSYLIDHDVTFGLADAKAGYAFGLGAGATITPYAVTRLEYDTGRPRAAALGSGFGVSLRHWFAGHDTLAPRGFLDLDIQARQQIAGDERASAVLATVTFAR